MSAQHHPFYLHLPIGFGQYSELSIEKIYTGTGELPVEYKKQEVMEALKLFKPLDCSYEDFFEINISENIISIEVKEGVSYYKGVRLLQFDACSEINDVLSDYYLGMPLYIYDKGRMIEQYYPSYDENIHKNSGGKLTVFCDSFLKKFNILHNGQPEYILG